MKNLMALLILSFAAHSFAAHKISCVATKVSGGPLEESFSVDEYPDVTVNETEASIGASHYSTDDQDSIEIKETATLVKADIVVASGEESFEVVVNKKKKTGKVVYRTTNEDETETIATLKCK
jgi:hypothetical protein